MLYEQITHLSVFVVEKKKTGEFLAAKVVSYLFSLLISLILQEKAVKH
jgi:hypothetical protein